MDSEESAQVTSQLAWRQANLARVYDEDTTTATRALLDLTFNEPDGEWMERTLLELVDRSPDWQVRALAVICLGHVARIHKSISAEAVRKLQALEDDALLRSRAHNALDDIDIFVNRNRA